MIVIWTPEAEQDRAEIFDTVATDNPGAAVQMDKLFADAAARLADHPMMGRPGKFHNTREFVPHRSYRLIYEIEATTVWILALIHTARQWPPVHE